MRTGNSHFTPFRRNGEVAGAEKLLRSGLERRRWKRVLQGAYEAASEGSDDGVMSGDLRATGEIACAEELLQGARAEAAELGSSKAHMGRPRLQADCGATGQWC